MGAEFNLLRAMFVLMPSIWTLRDVDLPLGPVHLTVTQFVGLLIAACFGRQLFVWRPDPQLKWIQFLVWVALLAAVPAILLAPEPQLGFGCYLRRFIPYLILLAAAHSVRHPEAFRKMLFAMLLGGILLIPQLLFALLTGRHFVEEGETYIVSGHTRAAVGAMHPHNLGNIMGVLVALAAAGLDLWPRWWLRLLIPCGLAAVYLSLYRTALAMVLVTFVPLAFVVRERRFLQALLGVGVLVACLNWSTLLQVTVLRDTATISSADDVDLVFSRRLTVNSSLVDLLAKRSDLQWLFGIGFRTSAKLYGDHIVPHNDFLGVLIDTGLCSLVPYCAILFIMSSAAIRRVRLRASLERHCAAWLGLAAVAALILPAMAGEWYLDILGSSYLHGAVGMMFGIFPLLSRGLVRAEGWARGAVPRPASASCSVPEMAGPTEVPSLARSRPQ